MSRRRAKADELQKLTESGNLIANIQGLHEVLLGMDPTGREMRSRGTTGSGAVPV